LVQRGDGSIDDFLDFLSNYVKEDAFLPLVSIAENLFQVFLVLGDRWRKKVAAVAKPLLERVLSDIGFEPKPDEKHTQSILRDRIIWPATLYGSKAVEGFAQGKFESLVRGETIHPDLRKSIMQVGALNAKEETIDWFRQRLESSESEHERMNVLRALGCFSDRAFIEKTQQYVLDKVPSRNKFVPIVSMTTNPYAVPYLWDWYVANVEELEQFHPIHYERVIAGIVPVAGIGKEEAVKAFFDDYMRRKDIAKDVIRLSLERLQIYSRMHSL
jgi:hypothetical protein